MDNADSILAELSNQQASDWFEVGLALSRLEALSKTSPAGRPWHTVLGERLKELGAPVSSGHLYKIRRAFNFLQTHAPPDTTSRELRRVGISSVEVAERLFNLDEEQGRAALDGILKPHPETYVELQRRYEAAIAASPESRSAKQLAWEKRKARSSIEKKQGTEGKTREFSIVKDDSPATEQSSAWPAVLEIAFQRALSEARTDFSRALAQAMSRAADLELQSKSQLEEISALRVKLVRREDELAEVQMELESLRKELLEACHERDLVSELLADPDYVARHHGLRRQ